MWQFKNVVLMRVEEHLSLSLIYSNFASQFTKSVLCCEPRDSPPRTDAEDVGGVSLWAAAKHTKKDSRLWILGQAGQGGQPHFTIVIILPIPPYTALPGHRPVISTVWYPSSDTRAIDHYRYMNSWRIIRENIARYGERLVASGRARPVAELRGGTSQRHQSVVCLPGSRPSALTHTVQKLRWGTLFYRKNFKSTNGPRTLKTVKE